MLVKASAGQLKHWKSVEASEGLELGMWRSVKASEGQLKHWRSVKAYEGQLRDLKVS